MTTLIEGMAKAIYEYQIQPAEDYFPPWDATELAVPEMRRAAIAHAKAMVNLLADPNNITPEMVEAGNRAHKDAVNYNAAHDCGTRFYRPKDPMKAALTAALTAVKEK